MKVFFVVFIISAGINYFRLWSDRNSSDIYYEIEDLLSLILNGYGWAKVNQEITERVIVLKI